jgi:Fe-S-cluster-containing dehydrogenase component/anaerobic selenocysteine-containing dehydrogenase
MKKYWKEIKSEEQKKPLRDEKKTSDEENILLSLLSDIKEGLPAASRRNFLKLSGFSFVVSALAACRSKIEKAIPYIIAPVEITPGEALYYASSYMNGNDYCSIIVKNRDGRPIKIEGNPESSLTKGGTSARVQASVLELYDICRFNGPLTNDIPASWENIDNDIIPRLERISREKGKIVLLTPSVFSPSTEAVISGFLKKYPGSEWVRYDAISYSAALEANRITFGQQVIPDYRFDRADLVVSFGADFLGTWLSPIEFTKQFSSRRNPELNMNHLIQLESNLSLTGCNADTRIQIKPSQEHAILLNIYNDIIKSIENRDIDSPQSPIDVSQISNKLIASSGKSMVISSSNVKEIQLLVNEINRILGNIGQTILFNSYLRTYAALDTDMQRLVGQMQKGEVDALLAWNVNPAYTWPDRHAFTEGLKNVDLTISLSGSPDETNMLFQYICPDNHYLECWNDAEPKKDFYSLMQPVISPIFDTRQMADTLLKWSGMETGFYDFIRNYWSANMLRRQSEINDPVAFFDSVLQKGIFEPASAADERITSKRFPQKSFDIASMKIPEQDSKGFEVILYQTVALGEGRQANNPWLHELPDPVTRICWDNYASISPSQALELDLHNSDVIKVGEVELPVHIQPGQAYGTIGIALGYGRTRCGKAGVGVGTDVWPMASLKNDNISYIKELEGVSKTARIYPFAQTQTHHTMEGREFVREADLNDFKTNPAAGNEKHAYVVEHNKSLYPVWKYPHHHWGMAIDLSKCTGCANCVIACQAENNIPVVGKEEVTRVHEMHWLRIDRYYSGLEDNPEVVFQPVLCQHCDNAPCENVCPVAATNHSSEGLNQMIYNRCFGTRYCNNNCPYKVRRFNWFNFTEAGTLSGNLRDRENMTSDLRRMVLNPDVTVRGQGVIEKCSFCVQRIQAAKLNAKKENRELNGNEVRTACSQSCPADAIVFGDMNDPESDVSKLISSGRRYNLLEELYTVPSVNYLTKIKNRIL